MIIYGLLSYCDGELRIPNKELMLEFESALEDHDFAYFVNIVFQIEQDFVHLAGVCPVTLAGAVFQCADNGARIVDPAAFQTKSLCWSLRVLWKIMILAM